MASAAFDESNWSNYFEITSDNTKVSEAVGDIMYDFANAPSGFWSTVKDGGGDIRIVNSAGDTAYSFELENFDGSNQTGVVFFDSQNLVTGSDVTWRVYYGNGSASLPAEGDTLGKHNVWGPNYKGVYRLNESSGTRIDSTSNSNDLSDGNTVTSGTGQLEGAADFEADNSEYLSAGDTASLSAMSPYSIVSWLNIESAPGTYGIVNKNTTDDSNAEFQYFYRDSSGLKLQADFFDSSQNETEIEGSVDLGTATWAHVVLAMDVPNATGQFYVDGSSITTSNNKSAASSVIDSNNPLTIGGQRGSLSYDGLMDEIRILETLVSANWVSTHYNNQNSPSTFWTTGAEQSVSTDTVGSVKETNASAVLQTSSGVIKTD